MAAVSVPSTHGLVVHDTLAEDCSWAPFDGESRVDFFGVGVGTRVSMGKDGTRCLAPLVETPLTSLRAMLVAAKVQPGDTVFDVGCGDGRVVTEAVLMCGCHGVGIDCIEDRVESARETASATMRSIVTQETALAAMLQRLSFVCVDATLWTGWDDHVIPLGNHAVIYAYLTPPSLVVMLPTFCRCLRAGARVVSHVFPLPIGDAATTNRSVILEAETPHAVSVGVLFDPTYRFYVYETLRNHDARNQTADLT